jgi:hypothetical protein
LVGKGKYHFIETQQTIDLFVQNTTFELLYVRCTLRITKRSGLAEKACGAMLMTRTGTTGLGSFGIA